MRRMAVRFWTLLFLVSLACIFKKKWNPVSGNHNPNVSHTIFSLSVIKEPAIKSIWCSTSFDRQLHIHFTSWRRYYYGIRPSLTSLLLLGGNIELNPGPAQKQERIENMYINQFRARKNVALWRCAKISIFLNRQLPLNTSISLQSLSRGKTEQYATRIFLFQDIRLSGKIEGHTREAVEYSSMLKTCTRPASLKNSPQYLKAIFNNYG